MQNADIKIVQFVRPHGGYTPTDTYAFPPADADRFVAAGLATIVQPFAAPVLDAAGEIEAAAEAKSSGARTRRVTKG